MSIPRLFCSNLRIGTNVLSRDEAHHAAHALRMNAGQSVILFDGQGQEAVARVIKSSGREFSLDVTDVAPHGFDTPVQLTLAVSMPKNHRQGYLIEKCTELGVAGVWPMITARTVAKPGPSAVEKWRRRGIEAAKQSGRRWLPEIGSPQTFDAVLSHRKRFDLVAIAVADEPSESIHKWLAASKPDSRILVLVGPEGGWTNEECKAAVAAGLSVVQITATTLRTETAAVAITAMVTALYQQSPPIHRPG